MIESIKPSVILDFGVQYTEFYKFINSQELEQRDTEAVQSKLQKIITNLEASNQNLLQQINLHYNLNIDLQEHGLKLDTPVPTEIWDDLVLFIHVKHHSEDNNFKVAMSKRIEINQFVLEKFENRILTLMRSKAENREKRIIAMQWLYLHCVNHVVKNKVLTKENILLFVETISQKLDTLHEKYSCLGKAQITKELKDDFVVGTQEQSSGVFWLFKQSEFYNMLDKVEEHKSKSYPKL